MTSLFGDSFLLPTLLLLLLHHPLLTTAQSTNLPPSPTLNPGSNPSLDIYSHTTDAYGSALPPPPHATGTGTSSIPTPSNASNNTTNNLTNSSILNYYFLLLALLIILIAIAYLVYARRQRTRIALSRRNGQRALARDLERWGSSGPYRAAAAAPPPTTTSARLGRSRREEGLDERGEAPPPYLPKEPEPVYMEIPLRELGRDQKPPDYEEGPSSGAATTTTTTTAR
ncbi:MAG: hypothetical protein LQ350_006677 [Teloschistes chrysophthalmus]|nr:MAG: hypothetical protein LQ350_006677 [Niorma chrysophthalma]